MLTEYEARKRHEHMGQELDAAPGVVIKCVALVLIATVFTSLEGGTDAGADRRTIQANQCK